MPACAKLRALCTTNEKMKKRKLLIILLIVLFSLGGIFIALKVFRIVNAYRVTTIVMEPTISINKKIICSNIPSITTNDIIMFEAKPLPNEKINKAVKVISRVVAKEDDTIVMKYGKLFVSNKIIDDSTRLSYFFIISNNDIPDKLTAEKKKNNILPFIGDSVLLNISYSELGVLQLKSPPKRILSTFPIDSKIFNCNSDNWTMENFGPIIIPDDCFFVLGDNRSNSADSRLRGFINKDKIIGKVIMY